MPKAKYKMRTTTGLTIAEMVVAMTPMVLIFAAILPQFRAMFNSWDSNAGTAETIQNGRVLIDHLNRNLAKAVRITAVSASSVTNGYIQFIANDSNTYRYDIGGSNYVEFGRVGNLSDLAGPVSSLQFTCYDGNDFTNTTTDGNSIRFVSVQTILPNQAAIGQDKTFTASAYLRTNSSSQTALTDGTPFDFDATSGQYPALVEIDATRYLCAYSRSNLGNAVVLTVDPSTSAITAGTRNQFDGTSGLYPALAQIDATRYLCAYSRSNLGNAIVLTVSGTTITAGTRNQFDGTSGLYPALVQIDATHYLCAYSRSNLGNAIVLTVSGTTITAGTRYAFDSTSGQYPALAQIDTTHYLCAYSRSNLGNAVVLTVSGTTITAGTRFQFDGTSGLYPALARMDSTHYLCAYTGPSSHGWAVVLKVNSSGWTISKETTLEYDTSTSAATWPALAQIDTINYLCAYTGPSSHGRSVTLCTLKP
ncbi:MAG: hypothetical protein WAK60_06530 [Sedimentisphaerales bacterium]